MLEVALQPLRGNNAQAGYPVEGQYGKTPVTIEGRIKLRTLDGSPSTTPVTRVVVRARCYEQCSPGPTSWPKRILWESTLVVKEADPDERSRWDKWSRAFRISVPPETRRTAPGSIKTKEYQVTWRVEAIVYHLPISGVGDRITKSYTLAMIDHTSRILSERVATTSSTSSSSSSLATPTTTPVGISCKIVIQSESVRLGEPLEASLCLKLPLEVRSARAQFSLQRKCTFYGPVGERRPSAASSSSGASECSSPDSVTSSRGLPIAVARHGQLPAHTLTTICQGDWIDIGKGGELDRVIHCAIVPPKEQLAGWDTGQTMLGASVDMTFNVHVRLRLSDGLFSRNTELDIVGPSVEVYHPRHDDLAEAGGSSEVALKSSDSARPMITRSTGKRKARPLETTVALYGLGRNANIGLPPPPKATKIKWSDREPANVNATFPSGGVVVVGLREALPILSVSLPVAPTGLKVA